MLVIQPLTATEQLLVDHAVHGDVLNLFGEDDRDIRADVVRAIMIGSLRSNDPMDPHGIQLYYARIVGALDLRLAHTDTALSFHACVFTEPLTFRQARLNTLCIRASRLDIDDDQADPTQVLIDLGESWFSGGVLIEMENLTSLSSSAVVADGIRTEAGLELAGTIVGGGLGALRLAGAHIGGQLRVRGEIRNDIAPALFAEGLTVDSDMVTAAITGAGEFGALHLLGAHIGGQLRVRGEIRNDTGPALFADRLTVDHSMDTEAMTGSGEDGALRLPGAHIGGQLRLRGEIRNDTGPALFADRLTVDHDMDTEAITGSGEGGALRLPGAHIGGQLDLLGEIRNDTGPAVNADGLTVNGHTFIGEVLSSAAEPTTIVSLQEARLAWFGLDLDQFSSTRHLAVSGLTYDGLPNDAEDDVANWIRVLGTATPGYEAQPYRQLAAAYRAAGHLGDQRAVLIAQDDHRRRWLAQLPPPASWRRRFALRTRRVGLFCYRWAAGYGYRPWNAAWLLLGIIVLAYVLVYSAAHTKPSPPSTKPAVAYRLYPPYPSLAPRTVRCSSTEQIGLALRVSVPLVGNITEGSCQLDTTSRTGGLYTAGTWLLEASAWATATLVAAGYTSVVRKS